VSPEAGHLAHQLAPLAVVEHHQPALGLQHLGAVAREVRVERVGAAGERERPGHLVEAEQLARLLLQHAPLGQLLEQPRHADLQLGRLHRLGALHVVDLGREALGVEAVEHQDPHVGSERLAHALDDRRHRRVDEEVRCEHEVGRAVDDALHDAPAGDDDRHAVTGRPQEPREVLGPLGALVDECDVSERAAGRRSDHQAPVSARRASSVRSR
jgi:hypothetical protein